MLWGKSRDESLNGQRFRHFADRLVGVEACAIGCRSRTILGWSTANLLRAELVLDAWEMAISTTLALVR